VIDGFNFPSQLKVAVFGFGSGKAGHTEEAAHANPSVVWVRPVYRIPN
jgi:hypothetical protein